MFFLSYDLIELGLLDQNWTLHVMDVVEKHGIDTVLNGTSSTSREPSGAPETHVRLVAGTKVKAYLPWLDNLYRNQLRELASNVLHVPMVCSEDVENDVNINALHGCGSRYEKHVDSNPVTGLLFVNSLAPNEGGALVFEKGNVTEYVQPRSGIFLLFDAREIPHFVSPLLIDTYRISIPMNFFCAGEPQERPADLDRYLYENGGTHTDERNSTFPLADQQFDQ